MAHQEACQLFIEQQIKEGLDEGKTPYSIVKDLSAWVEKLFETSIPADTLKKRAQRMAEKELGTNVPNPTTPCNSSEISEKRPNQPLTDDWRRFTEGTAPGPGRPPKFEKPPEPPKPYSYAPQMTDLAISHLSRIPYDDPERKEGGQKVIDWINNNLLNDKNYKKVCRKRGW